MNKKTNSNQSGFSVVEVLVVILVLGLIGVVGWLVYDRQNSKNEKVVVNKPQSETKNESDAMQQPELFEIKELGVKFERIEDLKGLYYVIGNSNKTAYFSLSELKGTDCAADKTAQVALTRYTDADFEIDTLSASLKDNAKKLGGYYYFSVGGQSACSEDAVIQEKASKLQTEILDLLPAALQLNQ